MMSVLYIHGPEVLWNYCQLYMSTHESTHNSLFESLTKRGCENFKMSENAGSRVLYQLCQSFPCPTHATSKA